jgi:hypothetical protein
VPQPPRKPGAPRIGGPQGSLPEFETGKEKLANEQLAENLDALEEELEEIKVKYEMYFIGAERMEPARRRDDLKRDIARMKNAFTRNAGIRFRIQALHARYLSYERLWLRSAREKEQGTYRRDLLKARRKATDGKAQDRTAIQAGERRATTAPPGEVEPVPSAAAAAPTPVPVTAPVPAAAAPPSSPRPPPLPQRPAPTPPPTMAEPEIRALFDAYVAAKRSCNEDVSKLSYEALARTVAKQSPEIAARFKARRVEFKVAVKDGKAVLTAVPKI